MTTDSQISDWLTNNQTELKTAAKLFERDSASSQKLEELGLVLLERHYYRPFITQEDLVRPWGEGRHLPGLDLNIQKMENVLNQMIGLDELADVPDKTDDELCFHYQNPMYGHGDADLLYGFVRSAKPRRVIEVGSGWSTRLIVQALKQNRHENPSYQCDHLAIEPYEQPSLEKLPVKIVRERVELLDVALFQQLGAGDILFVDSSHIIRPQGDVTHLYLTILPLLQKGVFVHLHDIFTPFEYHEHWVFKRKILWNEQYLLEALLSGSDKFETLFASYYMSQKRRALMCSKLEGMRRVNDANPGSFWIRTK